MILKLGMQHWVFKYHQIPSNDDFRFTFNLEQKIVTETIKDLGMLIELKT